MSIKTVEVFTCDYADCQEVHRFGGLPDGWVWAAWRREVPTGNPQQPMTKKASEHHFCSKEHFNAWKKANDISSREVQSSIDLAKVVPNVAAS